jgi:hypothetical protein
VGFGNAAKLLDFGEQFGISEHGWIVVTQNSLSREIEKDIVQAFHFLKGGFPLLEAFRTLQFIGVKAVDPPDRFRHAQHDVQLA